jgi:cytochrome-b5 reductase
LARLTNQKDPGGVAILLETAGQDCSEAFEDVGHSTDAREVLEKYLIGKVPDNVRTDTFALPMVVSDIYILTALKERIETLAHTKPQVVPQDTQETESQDVINGHLQAIVPALSAGLLFITSFIWIGGRVIRVFPALQSSGGFWVGFSISSLASISIVVATGIWFKANKKSKAKESFPSHIKSGIKIAKQRSINAGVINPREFRSLPLIEKQQISPDTYRLSFGLPEPGSLLGLPTGQHVSIRHENAQGDMVSRSYTPVSTNRERGRMELVVKTYPNGFMSQYLANLAVGDRVDFRGPGGQMKYTRYLTKEIGMIAGGSGKYHTRMQ